MRRANIQMMNTGLWVWSSIDSLGEDSEGSSMSNDALLHCSGLTFAFRQILLETNQMVRTMMRIARSESEWDETELQNDQMATDSLESQPRTSGTVVWVMSQG